MIVKGFHNSKSLFTIISWWNTNYAFISEKECWYIYPSAYGTDFYVIYPIVRSDPPKNYATDTRKLAAAWGWMFDENAYIIGFDFKLFQSKQHLLTGYELGIL